MYPIRHFLFAIFMFFAIHKQELASDTCSIFIDYPDDVQTCYTINFRSEQECLLALEDVAKSIKEGAYEVGYSMETPCPFIERAFDHFLCVLTDGSYPDASLMDQYVPSSAFPVYPGMQGWDSAAVDDQAQTPEAEPFFSLRLTERDKKNISILLTDLAEKNYLQLLAAKKSMNRKGDRVRVVHPMRFIGYILSDSNLHRCLKIIQKDGIKFKEFVGGFEDHMAEEALKDELLKYVPGLAQQLKADPQVIETLIESKSYATIIKKFL